jgi:hypothetical protein
MGNYCRTGVNPIIMPGKKIGSYSVGGLRGILYEDVPSKTVLMANQEQETVGKTVGTKSIWLVGQTMSQYCGNDQRSDGASHTII